MNDSSNDESSLCNSVILNELSKIEASDIMIPRSDVILIDQSKSLESLLEMIIKDGHSRYPVFDRKVDNITGILNVKDLFPYLSGMDSNQFMLRKLLRKPLFVSENKKADELLSEFRSVQMHIAIVVNEYGTMLGIVTLEDVLELIVGEINDEFDKEEKLNYINLSDNEVIVYPKMDIKEFNDLFKTRITSEDFETVGGFIIDRFGYVPSQNEILNYGNYRLKISKVQGSKLKEIIVERIKN